ncbi:MAG TPA: BON domain-containing protein [Nitrospiraceae bacterium]|nr:BON domain-containing protein [Nitrospiraceae bacterium]
MVRVLVAAVGMVCVLGLGACQSTTGKTAGQTMTDSKITASVQSKLTADRAANFTRVDVDTDRGVVSLSGVVPSADQKSRAEELARQVNGVTRINNNLQIQSSNR